MYFSGKKGGLKQIPSERSLPNSDMFALRARKRLLGKKKKTLAVLSALLCAAGSQQWLVWEAGCVSGSDQEKKAAEELRRSRRKVQTLLSWRSWRR